MKTEKLTTPIGDFEFVLDGYPTNETAQKLWEYVFVGGSHEFLKNGVRNLDARTLFHFTAICVTPAMVNKNVGAGSQYLGAYVDAHGDY